MRADSVTVTAAWLTASVSAVFRSAGLSAEAAQVVAGSLVEADLRGIPSHGVLLVPMYLQRLRAGSVTTREQADVIIDLGAIAVLDAGNAMGQLTGDQAMALAVEKARRFGAGAVSVRHAFHFGGAFRYAAAAAAGDCIGIAAANTRPLMPAPGGAEAVTGNNPLAIAVPRVGAAPVILDMALSEAALGKIRLAARQGQPIPGHWATDAAGTPTTDPDAALAGLLLPAAGPKGYGLALMIDVLSGVLSGGAFGAGVKGLYADVRVPNDCAHFFVALAIAAFGDREKFADRMEELVSQVTGSRRAPGTERLLLPGQLEEERARLARANGVAIAGNVLAALADEARQLGVNLDLAAATGARGGAQP